MADKSIKFGLFADDQASAKFDRVGQAAEGAGRKMRDSGSSGAEMGRGIDKATDAADAGEAKAQGFSDTLTGTADIMSGTAMIAKGNLFEGFVTLGGGAADLAGGMATFLLPAIAGFGKGATAAEGGAKKAGAGTRIWAAGQRVLNAVMRANPIGLVITAVLLVGAALVLAYKRSETFRRIVQVAFALVKQAGSSLVSGIRGAFNWFTSLPSQASGWFSRFKLAAVGKMLELVGWVRGLPGRIKGAVGNLGSLLWNAGADVIGGLVNGIQSKIGELQSKLSFVTGMIPNWKGPPETDATLLRPAGRAIMAGLNDGLDDGLGGLRSTLGGVTRTIASVGQGGGSGGGGEPLVVQLVLDGRTVQEVLLRLKRGRGGTSLGLA